MEYITVHITSGQNTTKQPTGKGETRMVMVNQGQKNETTTLCIPTEEQWRKSTAEDHDLRYIKSILSGMEGKPIDLT